MTVRLGLRDWGSREALAAARGVCGFVRRDAAESRLDEWFATRFGKPSFALDSGRSALILALGCLQRERPERDEVIVPALGCPALTDAVVACGLRPVYADIGDDLNTPVSAVEARLTPRTLALVMVHAYGLAADVAGLDALCAREGIGLVDDAAQRVDPASGLGTAGDFGVFSFAQSKSVVTGIDGSGGVLLANRPRHAHAIASRRAELPVPAGRLLAWLEFLVTPHSPRFAYQVARMRAGRRAGRVPSRIAALDAGIALAQLTSLDERRTRRVRQLEWYRRALAAAGISAPQLAVRGDQPYLARLMVRVPGERRAACRHALASAGIDTRLPYALPNSVEAREFPGAVSAAFELLEVPLPADLSEEDTVLIASLLRDAIGEARPEPASRSNPTTNQTGTRACGITGN